MDTHHTYWQSRRALRGFGKRKAYLIELLRQHNTEIDHFIIAGSASRCGGDLKAQTSFEKRRAASERIRAQVLAELESITKDLI